ncbi:MAG: hypothetical protein A2V67_01425 [Deltaproteobacteria bacterium RBG_13_61_14]|nr:MAG: hypothetical protein A2V67_01425 [Deltaproteobacteria bacterium RBG_13_61_14]
MIRKILDRLRPAAQLAVAAHQNPEGDALGSTLALALWLQSAGKDARAYNLDPVPSFLRFLPGADTMTRRVEDLGEPALIVVVDCGDLQRTGPAFAQFAQGREIINLDHHDTNDNFGALNLVRPDASSTCEIVYELIVSAQCTVHSAQNPLLSGSSLSTGHRPLSTDIATNLYTGILMDTGSFRFPNTTPNALRIASELVRAGADPARVAREVFDTQPQGKLKLLARVLSTLEFDAPGRVAEMVLTQAMFAETGTSAEDAEGFINHTASVEGVKVAVLFREQGPDKWKVSFRGRVQGDGSPGINVARIAEELGGGGHRLAAGTTLLGSLERVRLQVQEKLAAALLASE